MSIKRDARIVSSLIQEKRDRLCNRCIAQVVVRRLEQLSGPHLVYRTEGGVTLITPDQKMPR